MTQRPVAAGLASQVPQQSLIKAPVPWLAADPPIRLSQPGRAAFFGLEEIHPTRLGNTMVLGVTGSGKSASAVMPILGGLLRYRLADGRQPAVLVIDPKRELEAKVRATLTELGELERLVVVGECDPIAFFSGQCPLSVTERIAKLIPLPGQVFQDNSYWTNLGIAMLRDMFQLEHEYLADTGQRLFEDIADRLTLRRIPQASSWTTLRMVLTHSRLGPRALKEISTALNHLCESAGIVSPSTNVMSVYTGDSDLLQQWNYVCMSAVDTLATALGNPDISRFADLDVLPDLTQPRTDIQALMDAGKVVLFCPEKRDAHRIAALALKAKWYEAVFARADLERPVGIVIDEAQLFLTNDPENGEQSFLDRCRAYRAITVLATQSLASLNYAFGSNASAQTALEIIVANTPSKIIFRSTDSDTVHALRSLIPPSDRGGPHIIDVRRPSVMKPGEAYFMFTDGSWGRRRVDLAALI